jgi:hypothetical protein
VPDIRYGMQNLPLKVAEVNGIVIHESNSTNTRCCQVQCSGRTKAACSNDQNACIVKPALSLEANIRKRNVTSVSDDIDHGKPCKPSTMKETASMDVVLEPLFHINGSRTPHAGGSNGLLVACVNHVACGKYARN